MAKTVRRIIKCSHYKGDGYAYDLIGVTLLMCERCEKKLRSEIRGQIRIEHVMKKRV